MLNITLLCNAGLAVDDGTNILLIDVPNAASPPFYGLPEAEWLKILNKIPPYDRVCGFCFTHSHPDHYCSAAMKKYLLRWPGTPVFLPEQGSEEGVIWFANFRVQYTRFTHAPLPEDLPPHAVLRITGGSKQIWIAADAALDQEKHFRLCEENKADAAFWNAMYLSYPWTRELMKKAADRNFIYHMPAERPDAAGIWRKCDNNFRRHAEELQNVSVLGGYPSKIRI